VNAAIAMHDAADAVPDPDPDPAPEAWAGEERLVREAVLLVATGMTPRVVVAGLAHGEAVRDRCTRFALESGARLRSLATSRSDRFDIVVETITA
jgi:hypothetical protein